MGSCCSCLCRDSIPDNHPTKFKVTNVDDEGRELGAGVMELTQRELLLHTHKRDAVRWPYLCLRRYGYDSNLFSFESGRRCQTGQGIFAFKCSRAEEIFNLLQDLMQCNSINVVEEPVVITRNSHPTERELSRTPQAPNTLGYTVQGLPNGFHSFPAEALSCPTARRPSASSLRHSSVGEDSTHALLGAEEQSHTYVNTASGDQELRGRHCMHSLPEAHPPFPPRNHSCSLEDRSPQVFLQPGEVKFVLGPTASCRRVCGQRRECRTHLCPPHNNNNNECEEEEEEECASPQCVYQNVNGLLPAATSSLCRGRRPQLPRQELCGRPQRRAALLHYQNLPALPPVWESQPLRRAPEEPGGGGEALTPSPSGCSESGEEAPLHGGGSLGSGGRRRGAGFLPRARRGCVPSVFSFDFPRPRPEPPRQLNYIQVELEAEPRKGPPSLAAPCAPPPAAPPARRTGSYAVIDLKKTAAMSSLQRALPRDDGTARKTRHNSTDLPL